MANQITDEALADILSAVGAHAGGASVQDIAQVLKVAVLRRTLLYAK